MSAWWNRFCGQLAGITNNGGEVPRPQNITEHNITSANNAHTHSITIQTHRVGKMFLCAFPISATFLQIESNYDKIYRKQQLVEINILWIKNNEQLLAESNTKRFVKSNNETMNKVERNNETTMNKVESNMMQLRSSSADSIVIRGCLGSWPPRYRSFTIVY